MQSAFGMPQRLLQPPELRVIVVHIGLLQREPAARNDRIAPARIQLLGTSQAYIRLVVEVGGARRVQGLGILFHRFGLSADLPRRYAACARLLLPQAQLAAESDA